MCLTQTATVLARLGDEALVDLNGRNRLVSNLLLPDVRVGEQVLVGLGCVLGRVSTAEADRVRALRAVLEDAGPDDPDRQSIRQPTRTSCATHRRRSP